MSLGEFVVSIYLLMFLCEGISAVVVRVFGV